MPRTISIAVSGEKTDQLIDRLTGLDGVVGLAVQRGTSLDPSGDVLTVHATNDGTRAILNILDELKVIEGGSILTSQLKSLISPKYQNGIDRESNETIWDEMAFLLRRETNISFNYLSLMTLSGAIAAVGLWTDTIHIVIGAMVIAPGFEPLLRIPFGWIGGSRDLALQGLFSSLAGYFMLALGAALTFLLLQGVNPTVSADLTTRHWVQYWSSVSSNAVVLAFLAGIAGAVTIVAQRSVLSAGVMIALALIPSMSIAGMALIAGNLALFSKGLVHWAADAGAVMIASSIVLGLKQIFVHRRRVLS